MVNTVSKFAKNCSHCRINHIFRALCDLIAKNYADFIKFLPMGIQSQQTADL